MRGFVLLMFAGLLALTSAQNDVFKDVIQVEKCGSGCCSNIDGRRGDRVWIIAVGDDYGTLDLLRGTDGAVTGWGKATIEAACEAAGINCKVVYAPYSICLISNDPTYKSHTRLGQGLEDDNYDACHTFFPTRERQDVAIFSEGYWMDEPYKLWFVNDPRVRPENLNIGFGPGPGDEFCVRQLMERARVRLNDFDRQVNFESSNAAAFRNLGSRYQVVFENVREATLFGQIDVNSLRAFDLDNDGNSNGPNDQIICSLGPAGLIAKKDKVELIEAFNRGLSIIKSNGVFGRICQDRQWDLRSTQTAYHKTWCTQDFN